MDTLALLRIIAATGIITHVRDALELADAIVASGVTLPTRDLSTYEGRRRFALTLPTVRDYLVDGKKIQAIKELREASKPYPDGPAAIGLKEAKDVIDGLSPFDFRL